MIKMPEGKKRAHVQLRADGGLGLKLPHTSDIKDTTPKTALSQSALMPMRCCHLVNKNLCILAQSL